LGVELPDSGDIGVLDVTAVFPKMNGNAVRAGRDNFAGGSEQVRFDHGSGRRALITSLPEGGDMVNVNAEFRHAVLVQTGFSFDGGFDGVMPAMLFPGGEMFFEPFTTGTIPPDVFAGFFAFDPFVLLDFLGLGTVDLSQWIAFQIA
jgi:hypothetical protein